MSSVDVDTFSLYLWMGPCMPISLTVFFQFEAEEDHSIDRKEIKKEVLEDDSKEEPVTIGKKTARMRNTRRRADSGYHI